MTRVRPSVFRSLALLGLVLGWGVAAAEPEDIRKFVHDRYHEARLEWTRNPTNLPTLVRFGAEAFAWADTVTTTKERAEIAEEAMEILRRAVRDRPQSAALHYHLAMNLGQVARTRTLGALRLVREMETHFKKAIELDASIDFAGPDRNLGQLYQHAPGWPASLGDHKLARIHLDAAVRRAPEFPANRLALAELLLARRDLDGVRRELEALETLWEKARKRWNTAEWDDDWVEWAAQKTKIRQRMTDLAKPPVPPKSRR